MTALHTDDSFLEFFQFRPCEAGPPPEKENRSDHETGAGHERRQEL